MCLFGFECTLSGVDLLRNFSDMQVLFTPFSQLMHYEAVPMYLVSLLSHGVEGTNREGGAGLI